MVISATGYVNVPESGLNPQMDIAAGGTLVCGLCLGAIGLIIMVFGNEWIEVIMPPGNTIYSTSITYIIIYLQSLLAQ